MLIQQHMYAYCDPFFLAVCFKEIEILVSAPWRGEVIMPKHVGDM